MGRRGYEKYSGANDNYLRVLKRFRPQLDHGGTVAQDQMVAFASSHTCGGNANARCNLLRCESGKLNRSLTKLTTKLAAAVLVSGSLAMVGAGSAAAGTATGHLAILRPGHSAAYSINNSGHCLDVPSGSGWVQTDYSGDFSGEFAAFQGTGCSTIGEANCVSIPRDPDTSELLFHHQGIRLAHVR